MNSIAINNATGSSKQPLFYGYIIVVACFLIMAIMWGTIYSFGVFLKSIATDFGWTRAMTSGSYSMFMFVQGLLCMITGRLNDRFGPRVVVSACGLSLGLGFMLMSQIGTLWQLYLFYGLLIAAGASGGMVPVTSTMARWFIKKRGLMSGIVLSGIGAGVMIGPPLAEWLISGYGWLKSYYYIGLITMTLIVLFAQFLRRDPAKMGQLPYGENALRPEDVIPVSREFFLWEAIRTRQFWALFLTNLFWGIILVSILVHIVPHATDVGISAVNAANILAIIGGVHIVGRIVICGFTDRIGCKRAMVIGFIISSVSLLSLQVFKELWLLYLFAAIFGFSYGGLGALPALMVAELFGMRTHGAILGIIAFGWAIGGVVGPVVAGHIFDVTGNYYLAFWLITLLSIAGALLSAFLSPASKKA